MWFKSLQIFKFTEDFSMDMDALETALTPHRFMPCRSIDARSQGFVAPNGQKEGLLAYAANGFILFCLQKQEKIVPASVVAEAVQEKVSEIEAAQGRKVRKREKEDLKEEITHQLVIRAFSKTTRIFAYIDTLDSYLVVQAQSHAVAEEFSVALRQALGSLKIEVPPVQAISTLLTNWLKTNEYPPDFVINNYCILNDPKDKGKIRCEGQNLFAEDIQTLIHEGRFVSELGLSWSEQISFKLKEDFSIKSIKFLEGIKDEAKDVLTENPEARFDADFTIVSTTLRLFIRSLFHTFGASS